MFVVLAGWALFAQRFTRKFLIALALTLSGMFLIFGDSLSFGSTRILGDLLGVTTAVFYAGYILCVARLRASIPTSTVMFVSAAVSALVLLPVALLSGENLIPASAYGWSVLIGLAWIAHAGGQSLIAHAYGYLSAALGALTQLWQPVAAAVLAWWLLQEPLGGWQALGGVVVLIGIYRARLAERAPKQGK